MKNKYADVKIGVWKEKKRRKIFIAVLSDCQFVAFDIILRNLNYRP